MHELHQTYLPNNKTFGKNDYNRHFQDWQRHNDTDKQLMIKQSQKYVIEKFSTPSLMRMGIKGNVLSNWNRNISNLNQLIKDKYSSVTSFVFFFFFFFLFSLTFFLLVVFFLFF